MKKTALSLVLTLVCSLGLLTGNADVSAASLSREADAAQAVTREAEPAFVDYASQAVLDLDADSQTMEVTVKAFIDGSPTNVVN